MNKKVILLENDSLLKISGPDAKNFLQGLATIDVAANDGAYVQLGGFCNNKGRVLASFHLFLYKHAYYLVVPKENSLNALSHLQKYAMFSKVEIKEVTEQFKQLGVLNEAALMPLLNTPPSFLEVVQTSWGLVYKLPSPTACFRVFIEREHTDNIDFENSKQSALLHAWKRLNILSGIPNIYPETSGLFTPQMLNYDLFGGISLTKGCYLGQEIVARTASLGRVKKHLQIMQTQLDHPMQRGALLYNAEGIEVGVVLDACYEQGNADFSAVIQDEALNGNLFYEGKSLKIQ